MKLRIKNEEEVSAFIKRQMRKNHTIRAVKGEPPVGATFEDGEPILGLVNVAWTNDAGETVRIIYEQHD